MHLNVLDADVPLGVGENRSVLPGMGLEHGLPPENEDKPKAGG